MQNDSRLIDALPWALYGYPDDKIELRRQLASEAGHFAAHSPGKMPFFSLLTPLWNTPARYLAELIESCLLQSFSNWELILVDDGSSNHEHWPMAEKFAAADPRIVFRKLPSNGGISRARNAAFAISRGSYVGILDHDDCLHPRILGLYFDRICAATAKPHLVYCNEVKINAEGKLLSDFFFKPAFDRQTLLRTNYIAHFAVVERTCLNVLNERDGHLFAPHYDGVEDHDYFLRLSREAGFRALHLPVFGYLWRKALTSTALVLDAKPYVKGRLIEMLAAQGERFERIEPPLAHPQCFPSLVPSGPSTKISIKVYIWGGDLKARQSLVAQLHQQLDVSLTIEGAGDEGPSAPPPVADSDDQPFLLLIHASVHLDATDTLARLSRYLKVDPALGGVMPRICSPDQRDCGEWRVVPESNLSAPWSARFEMKQQDFPADERIGALPTPFFCLLRSRAIRDKSFLAETLSCWTWLLQEAIVQPSRIFYVGTLKLTLRADPREWQPQNVAFVSDLNLPAEGQTALLGKLRDQMGYDQQLLAQLGPGSMTAFLEAPLRYRMADTLNSALKKWGGPVHNVLKKFVITPKSSRTAR